MISSNRRQFLGGAAALVAAGSFPMPALAQAKPKLVVVGGGPGGATIAKYVAKDSSGAVEVTLVEPLRQFTTCFHSNLYLGGFRTWEIDHPFLRCAGVQIRRQARASGGAGDRSREEERSPRRRIAAAVRPAGGGSRDRHQVRFGAGLFGGGFGDDAARLEAGAADPAAQAPARCGAGRRGHRHDRAAQSLSLPARALRARLDDGARAQGQGTHEIAHRHPRSQGDVLEAGLVPGGLGKALSRHGRVAGPEDARRHQERRCLDHDGRDRPRQLQGGPGQCHSGADGGQDRARRRPGQSERLSARSIPPA